MEQKDIISIFPEQGTHNKTTLVLKKPKTMSSSIDNLNGCRNIPNKEHMLAYPHKKLERFPLNCAGYRWISGA